MKRGWALAAALVLMCGCAVGPNYKRPAMDLPGQYRGPQPDPNSPDSIADRKWEQVFGDDTLNGLIRQALERNFDLRIAAERVQQARAQLGSTRANLLPFLDAQTGFTAAKGSTVSAFPFIPEDARLRYAYTTVGAALSWELDIFGRLRRLTEAARAQYLASEEARHGVIVSLISEVATGYFQLREQDLELDISRRTRALAEDGLRLVRLRNERGAASGLDVSQAEQLLYTATAQIASVERSIGQTENSLSLLLAEAPSAKPRGKPLEQMPPLPQVPAGLPSSLLARRPDVRQAEQNLVAANAQIGAARALYFPQISLTAFAGAQSRALTEIASFPARAYSVAPAALLPIFHAGQIRSQVRLAEAQQRELLIAYQRSVFTALREVSDALIGYDRTRGQREQQEQLVRSLSESVRLSNLRYQGGLDSYLQVLDAERNLFQGQLVLSQLRLQEQLSVVQLYRALGGGWQ